MTPDTLILGAGASGLACACELSKHQSVLVLEARDRVGGRMFTQRLSDYPVPIDLGPEFIHGRPKETFDLLEEAGLLAYDLAFKNAEATRGDPRWDESTWEQAFALMQRMGREKQDCSFKDFIDRQKSAPRHIRERAISYVEGFNAARHELISVHSLVDSAKEEEKLGDTQFRLVGGHDQLAAALLRSIHPPSRVELNCVVKAVKWSRRRVEVTADTLGGTRTYRARRAVIALPLGVLQADAIRFEPELPVRKLIREQLVMGHVIKITLRCRTPFWEAADRDLSFLHAMHAPIPVWWTTHPLRTTLLTGWVGGSRAEALDKSRLREAAVESLRRIFHLSGRRVADEILAVYTHDWSSDPFSRGAYSYAAVGGARAPHRLARPIAGTLYFAGEHTHTGLMGTVAGALHSGYRAAGQIVRAASGPAS